MSSASRLSIIGGVLLGAAIFAGCGSRVNSDRSEGASSTPAPLADGVLESRPPPLSATGAPASTAATGLKGATASTGVAAKSANAKLPEDGYVSWAQLRAWWPHALLRGENAGPLIETLEAFTQTPKSKGDPAQEFAGVFAWYAPEDVRSYGAEARKKTREAGGYVLDQYFAPTGKEGGFFAFTQFDQPVVVRGQPGGMFEASDGEGGKMRCIRWRRALGGSAELQYQLWTPITVSTEQAVTLANSLKEYP